MQAFVMQAIGKVAIVEKPIPEPGPDEAIVRTTHALVCTSDVHTLHGALSIPLWRTLGHESVGTVWAAGSNVHGFQAGERVAVNTITPCWRCEYCQRGFPSQCGGMLGGHKYTAWVPKTGPAR
jgi:isopropanol dehydrogenase (NADP+)